MGHEIDSITLRENISNILKYLRKANSLSQSRMASIIDCKLGLYHRIESQERELSYLQAIALEEHFKLGKYDLRRGLVTKANFDNTSIFRVPDAYRNNAYSYGRVVQVYKRLFEYHLPKQSFVEFLNASGIDPLACVDLRNSFSIEFTMNIAKELRRRGYLKNAQSIKAAALFVLGHSDIVSLIDIRMGGLAALRDFVLFADNIEKNHAYTLENFAEDGSEATISFKPKEHIDLKRYRNDYLLGDFMRHWVRESLGALVKDEYQVREVENIFEGGNKCTYTYYLA